MNETIKSILERRSRRAFDTNQISTQERDLVLQCGNYAPSAKNQQSWHFSVLQNPNKSAELVALAKERMGIDTNPFYNAPTIILVSAKADNIAPIADGSLAMQNMMLAAHSLGLGTCWINCINGIFTTEIGKNFFAEVGVPEGYITVGSLAIGYPIDGAPALKERAMGTINIVE